MTADAQPSPLVRDKGLSRDDMGLAGSVSIGLSSTAPVYSLAAALGFVVLAVGVHAPAAFLLAFVPMLFIAVAYRELNSALPDCGTTFTWASAAFGRFTGWLGGWGLALSGVVVLANLAQVAGTYLWLLVAEDLASNTLLVTATGVAFIAAMTWTNYRGIDLGEKMQRVTIIVQYAALAVVVAFLVWRLGTGDAVGAASFSADWFNPLALGGPEAAVQGALIALFAYWGWDTCLALNEETRRPRTTPGRAAIISSVILVITYTGVSTLAILFAGVGSEGIGLGNEANAGDVFYAISDAALGPWAWVAVLAVLVSAIAATQTTILPTARGTLAMAVHGALPRRFATVHATYMTPTFSTVLLGATAAAYYVVLTLVSDDVLADSIASLGLFIAFYYGLTGFACVWYFRHTLRSSARHLVLRGVLPLIGALLMTAAFVGSAASMFDPAYGATVVAGIGGTFVVGVGALLLGVVLTALYYSSRRRRESADRAIAGLRRAASAEPHGRRATGG